MIRPQLVCDRCGATCATGGNVTSLRAASKAVGWTVRHGVRTRAGIHVRVRDDLCPDCSEQFAVATFRAYDLAFRVPAP